MINIKEQKTKTEQVENGVGISKSDVSKIISPGCIMAGFGSIETAIKGEGPLEGILSDRALLKVGDVSQGSEVFSYPIDRTGYSSVSIPNHKTFADLSNSKSKALFYIIDFDFDGNKMGYNSVIGFEGLFGTADIYINGGFIETIKDGFYTTELLATDYLKRGKNVIGIKLYHEGSEVEDRLTEGYLGIYRSVLISYKSVTSITDMFIRAEKNNGKNLIFADITFSSYEKQDLQYGGEIIVFLVKDGKRILRKDVQFDGVNKYSFGCERVCITLDDAEYWSPEDPNIYRLVACLKPKHQIVCDIKATNFGFSNFSFEEVKQGGKNRLSFLHNYNRFIFKGSHYNHGERFECNFKITLEQLKLYKEYGFNSLVIDNPSELILTICDHVGMAVIVRVPLKTQKYSRSAKQAYNHSAQLALKRAATVATQFKNHPSVAGWLIETADTYLHATLANMIRTIDSSRPVVVKLDSTLGVSDFIAIDDLSKSEMTNFSRRKWVSISKLTRTLTSKMWASYYPLLLFNVSLSNITKHFETICASFNMAGGFVNVSALDKNNLNICKNAFSLMPKQVVVKDTKVLIRQVLKEKELIEQKEKANSLALSQQQNDSQFVKTKQDVSPYEEVNKDKTEGKAQEASPKQNADGVKTDITPQEAPLKQNASDDKTDVTPKVEKPTGSMAQPSIVSAEKNIDSENKPSSSPKEEQAKSQSSDDIDKKDIVETLEQANAALAETTIINSDKAQQADNDIINSTITESGDIVETIE